MCFAELASIYHGDTVCRISQDLPNHNWLENKLRISPDGDGNAGGGAGAAPSTPTSPTKTSEPPPNKDKGDKGTFTSLHALSLRFDRLGTVKSSASRIIFLNWWLVRATYVVDGWFFGHFFWKVEGTVRIHVNHRVPTDAGIPGK